MKKFVNNLSPAPDKDIDGMYAELLAMVDAVENDGLKNLLNAFFRDVQFAEAFKHSPGAMHHAWVGGLLEHSLAVARTAKCSASNFNVDMDIMVAGALLHDIGKLRELEVSTCIELTEEGLLLGHVTLGCEMVRQMAAKTGLDARTTLRLSHVLISHHGKCEYGSPKRPMLLEALLVSFADETDSKASHFERIKRKACPEDVTVYDEHLGEIFLK